MELTTVLDALSRLGALGAAGLIIYGLLSERIVPAGRLDEMRRDRREGVQHAREAMALMTQMEQAIDRLRDEVRRR